MKLLRKLCRQFARTGLDKNGAIREDDGWYAAHTTIYAQDVVGGTFIFLDIDIFIGDATRIKPAPGHTAITAPRRDIHLYCFLFGSGMC